MRAARLAAGTLLLAAGGLAAQAPPLRVSGAVAPETVTVGDRFRSVLQVVAPLGTTVEFSPLAIGDTLQPADSLRVLPARAGEPPIAVYSLVAWIAARPLSAQAPVRVSLPDGSAATYLVPLRLPVVRSVLPADAREVEPRPARGELPLTGAPRPWWPWALLLATLLALAVGAWRLLRLRGAEPEAVEPSARERALRELHRVSSRRAIVGEAEALYPDATSVLRHYLAEVGAAWGTDLTTRELLERLRLDSVAEEHREPLRALLQHADRVKFARYSPTPAEVDAFFAAACDWIRACPPAPAGNTEREAA